MSSSAYCSMPGLPAGEDAGRRRLPRALQKTFNADVQVYAPYAYDAAMAIITAMQSRLGRAVQVPARAQEEQLPGVIG